MIIKIFHNVTYDGDGRKVGFGGYEAHHVFNLVFEYEVPDELTPEQVLNQAYDLFNVGDDPEFGTPDERAVDYRKRRNRSLSAGDVVQVGDAYHSCDDAGWGQIEAPNVVNQPDMHGSTVWEPPRIGMLDFGLGHAVPWEATSAWGARMIVTQDGVVDLVWDRTDQKGTETVIEALDMLPLDQVIDILRDLLKSYIMRTREAETFVLHQSDNFVVVADTKGSCGYCYVAAWTTRGED